MRVRAWLAVFVTIASVAGCGGEARPTQADRKPAPSQGDAGFPSAATGRPAGGNLVNAAEMELVSQEAVSIEPRGTAEVELAFGNAEAGSVIVLTDKPKIVTGAVAGEPLDEGDLFGLPALFINLVEPGGTALILTNSGFERATATVQVRALTDRKIELDVSPRAVPPGQPVTLTATVTGPAPNDVVHITVGQEGRPVAERQARRLSTSRWQTLFRAQKPGFYAVTARVEGGPSRFLSGVQGFEVADRGTAILGFDERLVDVDRDGLAEYLSVRVRFAVAKPGQYMLSAGLGDRAGEPLRTGGGGGPYRWLEPGRHSFELKWQAETLRSGGVPGPWRLINMQLIRIKPDFRTESDIRTLGTTKPYGFGEFERGEFD